MKKEFLQETARDTIAIGGIAMFILVLVRSSVGQYFHFTCQILIAGIILTILNLFIKSENHTSRAIIIYFFTIPFYNNPLFTIFATIILILIFTSLIYLKYPKKKILLGILNGIISSTLSYLLFNFFF